MREGTQAYSLLQDSPALATDSTSLPCTFHPSCKARVLSDSNLVIPKSNPHAYRVRPTSRDRRKQQEAPAPRSSEGRCPSAPKESCICRAKRPPAQVEQMALLRKLVELLLGQLSTASTAQCAWCLERQPGLEGHMRPSNQVRGPQ